MYYATSYYEAPGHTEDEFIYSDISKNFLTKNNINMPVNKFKDIVKRARPSRIVLTGGAGYARHTKVYSIKQFEKYQEQRILL